MLSSDVEMPQSVVALPEQIAACHVARLQRRITPEDSEKGEHDDVDYLKVSFLPAVRNDDCNYRSL